MYQPLLTWRLALLSVFFLFAFSGHASHMYGGEITYRSLGNNQYRILIKRYEDCKGSYVYNNTILTYRNTGCNGTGTSIGIPASGSIELGSQYCPTALGTPLSCLPNGPWNYIVYKYETTITLPPGRWVLGAIVGARPILENVRGSVISYADTYLEAILDNSSGLANNSVVFTTAPIQFVNWKQPTRFSNLAFDADGDSLVYSLVAPLENCNSPVIYKNISSTPNYIDFSSTPGVVCFGQVAANSMYSATFPIPSFVPVGTCPVVIAQPSFNFSSRMGEMAFTPAIHNTSVSSNPANWYAVAVKIEEYRRRPNNTYVLVGSTQRDMMAVVINNPNRNPALSSLTVNGTSQPIDNIIQVVPGQLVSVQMVSGDTDAGQFVTLTSNAEQVLPGSDFVSSGPGPQPTAVFNWIPPVTLRPGLYYCTIISTDNACPIKGIEHRTLTFRVGGATLATQAARNITTLAAVPTPFTGEVSFQLAQPGVQTVVVFDQLGRQVTELRSQPSGKVQWQPAATVPAGLYLARSQDGQQVARLLRTGTE